MILDFEPEVVFNMDLANAPTGERFCREAMDVLRDLGMFVPDVLVELDDDPEALHDAIREMEDLLSQAGMYAHWDAGDVVVYDLRNLSESEREAFFDSFA